MPIDWERILAMAPLAFAQPGSPEAMAFMEGQRQSQERQRRDALDQEQAWLRREQAARQETLDEAQILDREADNRRQDEQLALQRLQAYARPDTARLGALEEKPETILDEMATPLSAQNDLTVQRLAQQQQYGVPPGTPQGPLPNMTQAVSNRDKRRAQQILDRITKNPLYAGYLWKPELDELSVQFKGGEIKKVRELREMAEGALLGPGGLPVQPMPSTPPVRQATPGSFEEYIDATPARQAVIESGRRRYQQADDRTVATGQPASEVGWATHTVTDPATNTTRMVRVNARTGEVQPVELPPGTQPGNQRSGRLSAGQQEDLATMATVSDLAAQTLTLGERIGWSAGGGFGVGGIKQFAAKNLGRGTFEEQSLRNNIGQILGTIAKLRGGTSFTPNEQRLLETYTPTINDNPLMLKSKLASLQDFIALKRKNMMAIAGAGPVAGTASPPTSGAIEYDYVPGRGLVPKGGR